MTCLCIKTALKSYFGLWEVGTFSLAGGKDVQFPVSWGRMLVCYLLPVFINKCRQQLLFLQSQQKFIGGFFLLYCHTKKRCYFNNKMFDSL